MSTIAFIQPTPVHQQAIFSSQPDTGPNETLATDLQIPGSPDDMNDSFDSLSVAEKIAFQNRISDMVQQGALDVRSLQQLQNLISARLGQASATQFSLPLAPSSGTDPVKVADKTAAQVRGLSRNV